MSNMKTKKRSIVLWVLTILASLGLLVYLFYTYIGGISFIAGRSMEPTLRDKMQIYVSKLSGETQHVKTGDIIVYRLSKRNGSDFISRVIGVEGDSVMIEKGAVQVNGKDYIVPSVPNAVTANFEGGFTKDGVAMIVPKGTVFVLGDNRMRSADSRDFGFIKIENIQSVYKFCYTNCQ